MASKRNYHGLSESGVFYRDRDEWMRYVQTRTEWDASTRLVGCYIATRINPTTREAWPMQSTIAKDLGVSAPTVKRAVATLVGSQLLRVRLVKPRGGRRAVNHYALVHPADEGSPMIPDTGITHDP